MIGDALLARTTALIARLGVPVAIEHAGVSRARSALVQVLGSTDRTAAFRTSEIADWLAPAYFVTLAGDALADDGSPVAIGDGIALPADYPTPGSLHILKIERADVGAVCLKTRLFCAAVSAPIGGSGTGGASGTSSAGTGVNIEW